ncbi:MAG: hypothetical protein HYU51_02695 [Candidatus Rokubacteria bacterium]|nr:hypothetical protein [Candidatus Rokubacteria bacterium]
MGETCIRVTVSLCGVVAAAWLAAPAAAGPLTAGPALPSGTAHSLRGPGASTTAAVVERLNAASMRPVTVPPAAVVPRPDMLWVPDRHVSVPGAPGGVLVPGHWERRTPEGDVYVPPLVIVHPGGGPELIPGGVRPPVESRTGP